MGAGILRQAFMTDKIHRHSLVFVLGIGQVMIQEDRFFRVYILTFFVSTFYLLFFYYSSLIFHMLLSAAYLVIFAYST